MSKPATIRKVGLICPVLVNRTKPSVEASFETGDRWVDLSAGIYAGAADEDRLRLMSESAVERGTFKSTIPSRAVVGVCLMTLRGTEADAAVAILRKSNPTLKIDLTDE